jgi:hypothetical protein
MCAFVECIVTCTVHLCRKPTPNVRANNSTRGKIVAKRECLCAGFFIVFCCNVISHRTVRCCAGNAGDNSSPRQEDKQVGQRGFLFKYTTVNYDLFVEKMKDKRASGLRAELQRFCKNFMEMNKPPREVAREMVQKFIAEFEERMAVVSLEGEKNKRKCTH